jgi:hypothetical protein
MRKPHQQRAEQGEGDLWFWCHLTVQPGGAVQRERLQTEEGGQREGEAAWEPHPDEHARHHQHRSQGDGDEISHPGQLRRTEEIDETGPERVEAVARHPESGDGQHGAGEVLCVPCA